VKLAQPAWLILLVLLPLLGVGAVLVAHLRRKQWLVFVAPRLRSTLLKTSSPLPRWLALLFLLAACAAIIGALAHPCGDAGTRTEKSLGRNVMIALDLSRSMRVSDVKPDRLAQAKMVIYELLDAMPNERIGLIGFAGDAYPYAPLTVDHVAVRETVEQIDESWVPMGGSNLASAVQLATDTLKKTGQKNNSLVILSDGEENAGNLREMIYEARQSGVYILTIGVGTEDGDYVPNSDVKGTRTVDKTGKPVISRLQAEVLRRLASETQGRYALAGSGADIPAMVQSFIKDLDAFEIEGRERAVVIEFYQWLVFPAILFLMVSMVAATHWRGVRAAVAVSALTFTPFTARADEVSAAKQALQQQHFPDAQSAYRDLADHSRLEEHKARYRLGEATAAYHSGDLLGARSAYSRALMSADSLVREAGHLGMGTTLFQLGWRDLTASTYPQDTAEVADFKKFDQEVKEMLENADKSAGDDDRESHAVKTVKSMITSWTDAITQYDSALAINPGNRAAINNKKLTVAYLNRLENLLAEEKEQTQQSIPPPTPGKSDSQGDDDSKKQPKNSSGDKENKPPGDKSNNPEKNKDGKKDTNPDDKPQSPKKDSDKPEDSPQRKPNKTPEEQARDILNDNADLEKGPLTPGRREYLKPEKDW